ncbi:MAG: zinc ribbon domain-containing protein [Chloroflexi bacterium HGW-Chloroflexi-10]|nr:MAG: zinc ribbon domain-containing protein [Chloroflexi bacterium HGW-Chloroflexi-10]
MNFDPTSFSSFALIGTAFAAAFVAVLWISLVIWTYRDIRRRSRDPLARILAVLVTVLLFFPGVLIYFILRPTHTLEDDYQQTLEEEALLQTIEDIPLCPGCTRRVQTNWMVCPNCQTKLKKRCHHCKELMELSWNICPYCATPVPGMRKENVTLEEVLPPLPDSLFSFDDDDGDLGPQENKL